MLRTVFVDALGYFHIVAAVFSDFCHLALLPPADCLQAIGGLACAQRGGRDDVELETVAKFLFKFNEEIKAAQLIPKIEDAVTEQYFVVEADVIEAHHEVCAHHLVDEIGDFLLRVDQVLAKLGTVGASDGDTHLVLVSPTTHVVGGAAGFEVEIDNVAGHEVRGTGLRVIMLCMTAAST